MFRSMLSVCCPVMHLPRPHKRCNVAVRPGIGCITGMYFLQQNPRVPVMAATDSRDLQMLTSQAEHFRERPFSWLWAEGGQQPALEASLGVGGFG